MEAPVSKSSQPPQPRPTSLEDEFEIMHLTAPAPVASRSNDIAAIAEPLIRGSTESNPRDDNDGFYHMATLLDKNAPPSHQQKKMTKDEKKALDAMRKKYEDRKRAEEEKANYERAAAIMRQAGPQGGGHVPPRNAPLAPPVFLQDPNIEPIDRGLPPPVKEERPVSGPAINQLPVVVLRREYPEAYINRTLQDLDQIAINIADCLYQQLVNPHVVLAQQLIPKYSGYLYDLTNLLLKLGNLADKGLSKIIDESNNKENPFNNDLKELQENKIVKNTLLNSVLGYNYTNMLEWLISNEFDKEHTEEHRKAIRLECATEVAKDLEPFQITYMQHALSWIFDREPNKSFADYVGISDLKSEPYGQAKAVCRIVLKKLVDIKVRLYCAELNEVLQRRLSDLVVKQMRDHIIRPLVRVETEHLMETIRRLDWKDVIDGVVSTVYEHTNAYLAGKEKQQLWLSKRTHAEKTLLEKWEAYKKNPENLAREDQERFAQNAEVLASEYGELRMLQNNQFWQGFCSHTQENSNKHTVHPVVQAIVNDRIARANEVKAKHSEQENTHIFFIQKAEQIVDILLTSDMQAINFWCQHLSLDEEIKKIILHGVQLIKNTEIAKSEFLTHIKESLKSENVRNLTNLVIKWGVDEIRETLKTILTQKLKAKLDQYSDPDELKEILTENLMPKVLIPKLVQMMAQARIYQLLDAYAAIFFEITQELKPDVEKQKISQLLKKLYADTNAILPNAKLESLGMTQEKFDAAVSPYVNSLVEKLRQVRTNPYYETYTPEDTQIFLNNYGNKKAEELTQNKSKQPWLIDFCENLHSYYAFFYNLVEEKNEEMANAKAVEIQKMMFTDVQMSEKGLTRETFDSIVLPLFNDLAASLRKDRVKPAFEKITLEVIKKMMVEFNKETTKDLDKRPQYGNLIHNLLIKMSTFSNTKTSEGITRFGYDDTIKNNCTEALIRGMNDIRKSPDVTLELLMESFTTMFAAGEPVKSILFGEGGLTRQELRDQLRTLNREKEELEKTNYEGVNAERLNAVQAKIDNHRLSKTQASFNLHLRNLTNLIYDLAMDMAGEKVASKFGGIGVIKSLTQRVAKGAALGTPNDFYELVKDLYQKVLGDHTRNKSLVYKVVDDLITALFNESKSIRLAEKIHLEAEKAEKAARERSSSSIPQLPVVNQSN
jgi:hypothetical protein